MLDLSYLGIRNVGQIHHNLSTPALYEEAVRRREGWISHLGPLVVRTGQYTGRSADDKFVVREPYGSPLERLELRRGFVRSGEKLLVESKMRRGRVYLDGDHSSMRFTIGSHIELSQHPDPLHLLGFDADAHRNFPRS